MLNENVIEALCERLVDRIEEGNVYALKKIGKSIKKIGTLSPSKAQELANVFKYGGDYEKITNKLAEITELNVKDIQEMFKQVAKKNQQFAKQFYNYKNVEYIPYEKNKALQNQVNALAKITQNEYRNISRSLGYSTIGRNGKRVFTELSRVYQDTIDKAILSVAQGKSTFQEQMYSTIKELGSSGLKTVDYASGRSIRLDSVVRMNMQGALRDLSNHLQDQFGEEYGADGVEISVHENPAPDHAEVQGRQFSKEEFEKFQNDQDAVDYQGKKFPAEFEGHDRRSISEYNCYHYIFNIVLGVNKSEYTSEQLQKIIDDNNTGFNYNGKHYTNYQGTQMQRKLETEIRKAKDTQILAKASGNDQLILQSQQRITQLTLRYKEFSDVGNLPTKIQRARVSGYHRTKVDFKPNSNKHQYNVWEGDTIYLSNERVNLRKNALQELIKEQEKEVLKNKQILDERNIDVNGGSRNAAVYRTNLSTLNKYKDELEKYKNLEAKQITLNSLEDCKELLSYNNIKMDTETLKNCDFELIKENTKTLYDLSNKYPKITNELSKHGIVLNAETLEDQVLAKTNHFEMTLNKKYYKNHNYLIDTEHENILNGYLTSVEKPYLNKATITHEFGHTISFKMQQMHVNKTGQYITHDRWDEMLLDDFMEYSVKKLNVEKERLLDLYISDYGKTNSAEAFAELFRSLNGGTSNKLSETLGEYLEERLK